MGLDYSAFNQPITKADIDAYRSWKQQNASANPLVGKILGIIGIVILGGIIVTVIISIIVSGFDTSSVIVAAIVIVTAVAVFFAIRASLKQTVKLHKFAAANSLSLLLNVPNPGYAGMFFEQGHSRSLIASLLFPSGLQIGNYRYVTGSGKNSQTHDLGFMRIKLPRQLPHMVLDAKGNNLFGKISNLPASFHGQTLSLEGNFDKYFTLYAPKEYERDALYIFTPDVMAAVIDAGYAYDMEVIDDHLVLYARRHLKLTSEAELSSLLTVADKIGKEIHHQSQRYADERVNNRTLDVVAAQGRRLKKRVGISTIIVTVLVLAYVIFNIVNNFLSFNQAL